MQSGKYGYAYIVRHVYVEFILWYYDPIVHTV